jgi:hypothetical protein
MKIGSGTTNARRYLPKPRVGLGAVAADVALNSVFYSRQGNTLGTALLKGGLEGLYFGAMPALAMTTQVFAPAASGIIRGAYAKSRSLTDSYNQQMRPASSFSYQDTQGAATMRQAAVQAIQGSKLNARNALGGEAALMHRSYSRR